MSHVPPIVFSPAGLTVPQPTEVLAGVFADIDEAFGGGLNPALETPQGQLATSQAAIIADSYAMMALFDARAFTLSDPVEVANYFVWRQRDAVRNSISMAAQSMFSHKRLHGLNGDQMQELLFTGQGVNWNDYPDGCKRGRIAVKASGERQVTYTDRRTQAESTTLAMHTWWDVEPAPRFSAEPGGFLAEIIPPLPVLSAVAPKLAAVPA